MNEVSSQSQRPPSNRDARLVFDSGPLWKVGFAVCALVAAVALLPDDGGVVGWPTGARAIAAVGLVIAGVRAWRVAVILDGHGVTVRNYFRTYRFEWRDIRTLGGAGPDGRAVRVFVTGRRGGIKVAATQRRYLNDERQQRWVDELIMQANWLARRSGVELA